MAKKVKRILALFLAVSMVLSTMSLTAFADGPGESDSDVEIEEVQEAQQPYDLTTEDGIKAEMATNGYKFMAVLASKLSDGSVDAVVGAVDVGYNATLTLPNNANSGSAVIGVGMQNVSSLGVTEAKAHTMILRDGTGGDVGELNNYLSVLYGFSGATVNATIIDENGTKYPVTYTISQAQQDEASGKRVITATPGSGVSVAWHAMVNENHFKTSNQEQDDSFIEIANGSWLQIGEQLLQFEKGYQGNSLKVDNINDWAELDKNIREAVELVEKDSSSIRFRLEKGTTLAVSNSCAELTMPVTVTVTGVELDGSVLTSLQDGNVTGFGALLELMGSVLDKVNGNDAINVTIQFGDIDLTTEAGIKAEMAANGYKFMAVLASKLSDGSVDAVVGAVDVGYNATLTLPNAANSGSAFIGVGMQNVSSLGVTTPRAYTMPLRNGGNGTQLEGDGLKNLLPLLYRFSGATVNAKIIDENEAEYPVTYTISQAQKDEASGKTVITATPNGDVSVAWHAMVNGNHFKTSTVGGQGDSFIEIANGSWLQIGNQLLQFEEDATGNLKLDNIKDLDVLDETIRDAVELVNRESAPLCFHLKAGTTLSVSNSSVELLMDVTVSTDMELDGSVLTDLRESGIGGFSALLGLMGSVLEKVNGKDIDVTIDFTCQHEYGAPHWTWAGYASATAAFTCKHCGHVETEDAIINTVTTAATYDAPGMRTYTATVTFGEVPYTDVKTEEIPQLVRPSVGGGGGGGTYTPPTPPNTEIEDPDTPLVDKPFLFIDVKEGDWFHDDVKRVFNLGLMDGITTTIFDPTVDTTRAMVAMILYRLDGEPDVADYDVTIPDLKDGIWYYDAAIWAYANGIFTGYSDGSFYGGKKITREELAVVLQRYAEKNDLDMSDFDDLAAFTDKDKVSGWATEGMQWAVGAGMFKGRPENRLAPEDLTKRAELAAVLIRFIDKFEITVSGTDIK